MTEYSRKGAKRRFLCVCAPLRDIHRGCEFAYVILKNPGKLKISFNKIVFSALVLLYIQPAICFAQHKKDSITIPASAKYESPTLLRKIFIGRNYRREWTTPVTIPIFHLKEERGGFAIVDSGGGKQTNTLRLVDKKGNEWVLRSVDKDIEKALVPGLRNTMVETLMQDLQSAIHPYAALTIPVLARAIRLTAPNPYIFFVPDDPAFGEHRPIFANTVCYLEDREPTADNSDTKSTTTVLEDVTEESDNRLVQKQMLKARLLDMLVGDWDRHEDQWRWTEKDSAGINYYYPIPRDRDFAYFYSDGLFIKFASRFSLPHMKGFTSEPSGLRHLNAKVLSLDMRWLNELTSEDWKKAIKDLQKNISDQVIDKAVKRLPAEVYTFSAKNIASKLKTRRDGLMKHAMRYYEFLSAQPMITGTDEPDIFTITSNDSALFVVVRRAGSSKNKKAIYQRKFNPSETKRISIIGLGGNDSFIVDQNVTSSIKLYLKGGEGNDEYSVHGKIKTRIDDLDQSTSKSVLAHK